MEVEYKSADGRFVVKFDVKTQEDLFSQLASFQEVFEDANVVINGIPVPAKDIQFRVRKVDDNEFLEKVYIGSDPKLWGYKLPISQSKQSKGSLYPNRSIKEDEKDMFEHDKSSGWRKFKRNRDAAPSDKVPPTRKEAAPF